MAEWQVDVCALPEVDVAMMMVAYTRRKRFEAKLLAAEVWTMLGEAMQTSPSTPASPRGDVETMSADRLFREIGMMDRG